MSQPPASSHEKNTAPTVAELDAQLPDYHVTGFLGAGGMGAVYRATQLNLNREVALKLFPGRTARGEQDVERFRAEASVLAQLSHTNIVSLFGFGKSLDGIPFFVMELIDGDTLEDRVQAGTASLEMIMDTVEAICEALAYAHRREVIHRDIKPSNVLIAFNGLTKLADFGLAVLSDSSDRSPSSSAANSDASGTPQFLAPEQLRTGGGDSLVDHRVDIYSLGAVFYYAVTGRLPVGSYRSISDLCPTVHRAYDAIARRALATNPVDRYSAAEELLADLRAARSGPDKFLEDAAPPVPDHERAARGPGRFFVVLTVVALLVGGLMLARYLGGKSRDGDSAGREIAPAGRMASANPPAVSVASPPTTLVSAAPSTPMVVASPPAPVGVDDPESTVEGGEKTSHPANTAKPDSKESVSQAPVVVAPRRRRDPGTTTPAADATPGMVAPPVAGIPPTEIAVDGAGSQSKEIARPEVLEFTQLFERYQQALETQVVVPSAAEHSKLAGLYREHLKKALDESDNGELSAALHLEMDAISDGNDEAAPELESLAADAPGALRELRAVYLRELKALAATREEQQQALAARFQEQLRAVESSLAKDKRLDEALSVREYRLKLEADAEESEQN